MAPRKLKLSEVEAVRSALLKFQNYRCPLCQELMRANSTKSPALDHDHSTGFIRDVLCVNCNGIEGKVFNLSRRAKAKLEPMVWLQNLIDYHKRHAEPQHGGVLHHTHKSALDKRLAANAKARKRRKLAKSAKK